MSPSTAGRVVVANCLQVKAIALAKIRTDKVDAYTLAQLLQADFLASVELPDEKAWALRQLVSHRRLLLKQRVAIKNTILAIFHRCLICPQQEMPLPPSAPLDALARALSCRVVPR